MAQLKIIRGREIGRSVAVPQEIFIGREEGNGLRLLDETSSRRHARVQRLGDRMVLFDLSSNNGTFVNGERVQERLLKDGDEILIGKTLLLFEEDDARRGITVTLREEPDAVNVEGRLSSDDPVEPSADYTRLRKLYDLTALLNATLDRRAMAEGVAALVRESLDADVAAVVDDEDDAAVRAREPSTREIVLSRAVLEQARRERHALLVENRGVESVMCAPLLRGDRWLGAIYADLRRTGRTFSRDDLAFVTAAAQQAALAFDNAGRYRASQARVTELASQIAAGTRPIGTHARFMDVLKLAERAAQVDATVLVLGESGTGKELIARLVHDRSRRQAGPFVTINCAAITETLLESELFGHEKGAFTGAVKTQPGKVETAEGGTLFLDEIGEISLALQAKLLRFLADRTFFRVGGARPRSVDVRIVAATNRDLAQAMKAGQFREDLYYRLAVVTIPLPPLRERREDIPALARHLLERVRARVKKSVREIAPAAMRALVEYTWPGNVRELENVIERAVILADGAAVELAHIPAEVRTGSAPQAGDPPVNLEEMEKWCVRRALERTGGKKGEAAQMLGISWPTLNKKLRDYGLEVGNVRQDGASDLEGVSP